MKKIFLIILLGSLLFPLIGLAGTYKADSTDVCYEGLVPCGKYVYVAGSWKNGKCVGGTPKFIRCQFCHFFVMLDEVINFVLFKLVPSIAILMLVIGGVMFIFGYFGGAETLVGEGKGGPKWISQAKRLITSVFIGLIIMFAAWLIINLFFQFIGVEKWTGLQKGWFQINCPIQL